MPSSITRILQRLETADTRYLWQCFVVYVYSQSVPILYYIYDTLFWCIR